MTMQNENAVENLEKETAVLDNHIDADVPEETNNLVQMNKQADESEEDLAHKPLLYGLTENPPMHITVVCALQQALLSLSGQLIMSLMVAEAVCASQNDIIKARLLSSTLIMSGVTTLAMCVLGVRLPLFQGAAYEYVAPLLLVATVDDNFCTTLGDESSAASIATNSSFNSSMATAMNDEAVDKIMANIQAVQGSLMVAGFIHAMLGFTGLVGVLTRFVGPLTIVPTMILLFIFLVRAVLKFVEVNWGIALSTVTVAVILFLYLSNYNMPVPVWTPSGGFRIVRYPLHQVFAILISILLHWLLCGVLTTTGVFTDDPNSIGFTARTDARSDIIHDSPWFSFPYPGQYGTVRFNGAVFISCMVATLISVLDSIGDYYACARVCRVPAPPAHAVNRGILIEGLCSFISGSVGCGHATASYGENIGAIGVTKVASRRVFVFTGIIYILFGVFGKFSAIFITIPYPVLGGAIIVMVGIFLGVVISNLEVVNLSSPRNIAILGLSVFIGLMIPTWVEKVKTPINTGNYTFDRVMTMLLSNPNLCGTLISFFLDNTVPGTKEERGIAAWQVGNDADTSEMNPELYKEVNHVYSPLLPERILRWKIMKHVPFLPYKRNIPKINLNDC